MVALQEYYGYLSDEALQEGADLLGMTTLELEELATFYDFILREPVGKYVIMICDGVVCWMNGYQSVLDHLCSRLGIRMGKRRKTVYLPFCPSPALAIAIYRQPC